MAFGLPAPTGVFIPDHAGTANLVTSFSRKPSTFKVAQWASYTPITKPEAYYLKLNFDMCARFMGPTSGSYAGMPTIWPRGGDAPQLTTGLESFAFSRVSTQRHADGYTLDRDTMNLAEWDIRAFQDAVKAQAAMTEREIVAIGTATDTSQYDATHYATAATWGGGYLDQGTAANPIFKRALQNMYRRIFVDTRGAVMMQDVVVVLNPATANAISQSPEITDFVKNNQWGLAQLKGELLTNWGLPAEYQGFRIVVDDTIYVPTAPGPSGATGVPQTGYGAWPWGTVAMLARPGSLMSPAGGPSFSTIHVFLREDMAVETMEDVNNRKMTSRIVNDYQVLAVAPVCGCLCTSAIQTQPLASGQFDLFMGPHNEGPPLDEMARIAGRAVKDDADANYATLPQLQEYKQRLDTVEAQSLHYKTELDRALERIATTTTVPTSFPEFQQIRQENESLKARVDALATQLEALTRPGSGDQGGGRKQR